MKSDQITSNEYEGFFANYINAAGEIDLFEELEISLHDFIKFVQNIPLDKFDFRYAEGKWSIKQIIQHLIDTERIFVYRALRFSRKDVTPLPGFDENNYVDHSTADSRSIQSLLTEFSAVRHSTLLFFKSLTEEQLLLKGTASTFTLSVRAIGVIIVGHQKHHQVIFQERYLNT